MTKTDQALPELVYKIVDFEEWDEAIEKGTFGGSKVDLQDGYIHFSTLEQLRETAEKHFSGRDDLFIVTVETASMARHYKMEISRGGAYFPHLYANLPLETAKSWHQLQLGENGKHIFPDEIEFGGANR